MSRSGEKTPVLKLGRRRKGVKLYEQIKDAIRSRIADGDWPAGHRLPTLRQLSEQTDTAYATVERAVRELVDEGLLVGRKRGGTVVAERRHARTGAIGIIGDTPYGILFTKSRYFSTLLMMLQECIVEQKRMVIYDHRRDDQPVIGMFRDMSLVDAVIVFDSSGRLAEELARIDRMGIAVVSVGNAHKHVSSVSSDSASDVRRALGKLRDEGHERIAYAIHSFAADGPTSMLRRESYVSAMRDAGAYDRAWMIIGDIDEQAKRLLALDPPPTAMLYPQSRHFPDLYAKLRGTHLDPHEHLRVCTYDENLWNTLTPLHVPFLSIEQRLRAIAQTALDDIARMLQSPRQGPCEATIPSLLVDVSEDGMRRVIADDDNEAPRAS